MTVISSAEKSEGQNNIREGDSEDLTEVGYIGSNRTMEQSRVIAIMTMVEYRVLGGEAVDSILAVDDRSGCRIVPKCGQWQPTAKPLHASCWRTASRCGEVDGGSGLGIAQSDDETCP